MTMDLFAANEAAESRPVAMPSNGSGAYTELDAYARAKACVRHVLELQHPVCMAFSSGKDSSATTCVLLSTAAEM